MSLATLPSLLHTLYNTKPGLAVWMDPATIADLALIYETDQWDECLAQADQQFRNGAVRVRAAVERSLAAHRHEPCAYPVPQTATALLAKTFDPLRCFVEGILAEGLTILAGKPKKGKSYLALDMSLSLTVGREAFRKFVTERARVLYVSLEDGERRVQRRLLQDAIQPHHPRGLRVSLHVSALRRGALEALGHYAQSFQVIIIDVIGRILPRRPRPGRVFRSIRNTPIRLVRFSNSPKTTAWRFCSLTMCGKPARKTPATPSWAVRGR